jgi:hypothetical protein
LSLILLDLIINSITTLSDLNAGLNLYQEYAGLNYYFEYISFMEAKKYKKFKDFYPFYLTQHAHKTNRALHFIGTSLVIFIVLASIFTKQYHLGFFIPLFGYGFAWVGHFFFEKNKPATFIYPIWSLFSDFLMFYHIITGQIVKKMELSKKQ